MKILTLTWCWFSSLEQHSKSMNTKQHRVHLPMTVQSIDVVDHVEIEAVTESEATESPHLPNWVKDQCEQWGEELVVPEWQEDGGTYREKHGWKVCGDCSEML
jgi:hypothetical protein